MREVARTVKRVAGATGARAYARVAGFPREPAMISCKLERIGDRVALILDDDAVAALNVRVGDTVQLEPAAEGYRQVVATEIWTEDAHARGRAFLKRYRRTFEQLL
jgi:hypothetical protein